MSRPISRMQLLRGDLRGERPAIRPPWAMDERQFIESCDRCGDCISNCPKKIITKGSGGFPTIDFSQAGCTFCGDCRETCKPGALRLTDSTEQPPWSLAASVLDSCLSLNGIVCRSCGESCEEDAIKFRLELGGRARPLVDEEICNGCGECVAVCPSQSLKVLPETSGQAA